MKGQWIGTTTGDMVGQIIVNVDDRDSYYSGTAYLIPDNEKIMASAAIFKTKDKNNKFAFQANVYPIDPTMGLICEWAQISKHYPGVDYSKEADVEGCFDDYTLLYPLFDNTWSSN